MVLADTRLGRIGAKNKRHFEALKKKKLKPAAKTSKKKAKAKKKSNA